MKTPSETIESPHKWVKTLTVADMQRFYLSRLPAIREAAKRGGYAIGLHGSFSRDLDLIAVPWIEDSVDRDSLASAIQIAACGYDQKEFHWEKKPQGRVATTFPVCWTEMYNLPGSGHIDLSVMPGLNTKESP